MDRNGKDKRLSDRQEKGISALLACPSVVAAAEQSGIGQTTLRRWLREPDFADAYAEARKATTDQALAQIESAMTEAVSTLRTIMEDGGATTSARVSAARCVLELGLKAVELRDIEERLRALEGMVRNEQGDKCAA